MSDESIAIEAREIAQGVAVKLQEREKLHDERHAGLEKSIAELRSILVKVGGFIISLIISVLGWSLLQQYNANETQRVALQEQVHTLQQAAERGADIRVVPAEH